MAWSSTVGKTKACRVAHAALVLYLVLAPFVAGLHLAFADHLHRYDPVSHGYMDVNVVRPLRSAKLPDSLEAHRNESAVGTLALGLWAMEPCLLSSYLTMSTISNRKGSRPTDLTVSEDYVAACSEELPFTRIPISFAPKHSPPTEYA
jgi:hypothetical protein